MGQHQPLFFRLAFIISAVVASIVFIPTKITFAGTFHSYLYRYEQSIIDPNAENLNEASIYAVSATSTPLYAAIPLAHDIAINATNDMFRIVDENDDISPLLFEDAAAVPMWKELPIIASYSASGTDIVVLDAATLVHSGLHIDLGGGGQGTISVFSSPVYIGISQTNWNTIKRNYAVYKNLQVENSIFTDADISYDKDPDEYIMVVLHPDQGDALGIDKVYVENPPYDDSREAFYAPASIDNESNETILTIDTKTDLVYHDHIDLTMYNNPLETDATVETSPDNNRWTSRGTDALYDFSIGGREIKKLGISYTATNDRFIRITIPQTGLIMNNIVAVSGPKRLIVFPYDPDHDYTLFYGNSYETAGSAANIDSTSTFGVGPNAFELSTGVQENDPEYIGNSSSDANQEMSDAGNFSGLWDYINSYQYGQTLVALIAAIVILIAVAKVVVSY